MSRSLVSSRLTFAAKPGPFVPVAAEGTSETDWLPEDRGFELPVPPGGGMTAETCRELSAAVAFSAVESEQG